MTQSISVTQKGARKFLFIVTLYITLLFISNLMATKLTNIFGLILPSAVIAYPLCFMTGDVLTEVWGYDEAKKVIWLGFGMMFLMTLWTNIGIYMPYPSYWKNQASYAAIFGAEPRITFFSFLGYLAGELSNSKSLEWIKAKWPKYLFVRTIGSSIFGQIFDTGIFIVGAFYGMMPNNALWIMVITQYLFKICCEALGGTPLAYALVRWARNV